VTRCPGASVSEHHLSRARDKVVIMSNFRLVFSFSGLGQVLNVLSVPKVPSKEYYLTAKLCSDYIPEIGHLMGNSGRADSASDPGHSMLETIIVLRVSPSSLSRKCGIRRVRQAGSFLYCG
jgi:hypothetical protein